MKTDALYLNLFETAPILALRLAGINVDRPNEYKCSSEELKKTFRIDALFTPPSPELPLIVAEAQFQRNAEIYDRLIASFAIKRLQSVAYKDIRMVVFFASRIIDTGANVYEPLVQSGLLNIVYLDEACTLISTENFTSEDISCLLLAQLTVSPRNEKNDAALVQELAQNVLSMPNTARQKLFRELFVDLFHSKYKHITKEEIRTMLDRRTIIDIFDDIGESHAVQEYAEKYAEKARLETIVENAKSLLRYGSTPEFVAKALNLPLATVQELANHLE